MDDVTPRRHLLGLEAVSAEDLQLLLDSAQTMKEISTRDVKKVPTLRGKTVINLFLENSTRTRISFEIAAKRLSADSINLSGSGSSLSKGETLADTARNLGAMSPDAIVIRHQAAGAARLLAEIIDCPIINAGDGSHEHPTQALLDLLTIYEQKPQIAGLTVAIVGDILHSRVARSNIYGLLTLGASVRLCGPPTLLPAEFTELGCDLYYNVGEAVRDVDVVMMLRIQRERQGGNYFPSLDEYARYFCLTEEIMAEASPDVIILHPGPMNRGIEISSGVADGPYSLMMNQVANGVAMRMAVLYQLIVPGAGGIRGSELSRRRVEPVLPLLKKAAGGAGN
ncbi:MAG: aspartate carbamoyltransferase catalytic subunit [Candidatus Binatia bacterium]